MWVCASGGLAAAVEAAVPLSYARFSWGGRQAAAARVTTGAWRMRTPRPRDLGHSKPPMEPKAIYEARSPSLVPPRARRRPSGRGSCHPLHI